ncbi:hypothetical protein ABZT03_36280 [Streptomyces sp. NPDC005574]
MRSFVAGGTGSPGRATVVAGLGTVGRPGAYAVVGRRGHAVSMGAA